MGKTQIQGVIRRHESVLNLRARSGATMAKDRIRGTSKLVFPSVTAIKGNIQPNRDTQLSDPKDLQGGRMITGEAVAYIRDEYAVAVGDLLEDGSTVYEVNAIDDWTKEGGYRKAILTKKVTAEG